MATPDSDLRHHSSSELLTPINGNFAGRDILSITQFDQDSFDKLFSATDQVVDGLRFQRTFPLLRGLVVISAYEEMNIDETTIRDRFPFESSVLQLGGRILNQELPLLDNPEFDYKIIDIKTAFPDAVIMTHSENQFIYNAARVFNNTPVVVPLINTRVFDGEDGENPSFAFQRAKLGNDVALYGALLALVLGKIK